MTADIKHPSMLASIRACGSDLSKNVNRLTDEVANLVMENEVLHAYTKGLESEKRASVDALKLSNADLAKARQHVLALEDSLRKANAKLHKAEGSVDSARASAIAANDRYQKLLDDVTPKSPLRWDATVRDEPHLMVRHITLRPERYDYRITMQALQFDRVSTCQAVAKEFGERVRQAIEKEVFDALVGADSSRA